MIDLKLPVFLVTLFVMSGCAEQPCTGSSQVSVESDHQTYRYRLDGGNGILEKREVSGGSWNAASEKPVLDGFEVASACLLYTSPSPRDVEESRMPSSA